MQPEPIGDIRVGTTLPRWSRTTDIMHWNRYAAVNDEFIDIHMDDAAGRAAGNERGAFGMGNLRFAYLHNALHAAFGDAAEVRELACEFRSVNQRGDVLSVVGVVTEVAHVAGERLVRLRLDVETADGGRTCPASALVTVPDG